jgi:hypothetical protein
MRWLVAVSVVPIATTLFACATQTSRVDEMQPYAIKTAEQRGSSELDCPGVTAQVVTKKEIEAPQTTGWYEYPHRSEFTVSVNGCGKHQEYLVGCDWLQKGCEAGPVPTATATQHEELADRLEPQAVLAAQQRGSEQLACPSASAQVTRKETIEEAQATGWYEPPRRALYTVDVAGCGKKVSYLVSCDTRVKGCATGSLQKSVAGTPASEVADQLQPNAVKVAQQRGSAELGCAQTTAEVQRKETVEEPQTTGWYEAPYRALYTVSVAGCGKKTAYLVACDKKRDRCVTGSVE